MKITVNDISLNCEVELSPTGHISNVEQPEAYTAALREFFASV